MRMVLPKPLTLALNARGLFAGVDFVDIVLQIALTWAMRRIGTVILGSFELFGSVEDRHNNIPAQSQRRTAST